MENQRQAVRGARGLLKPQGYVSQFSEQQTLLTKSKFLMERLTPGAMSRNHY